MTKKTGISMGQLVMTRGVNDRIADDLGFAKHVTDSLARYRGQDWGDVQEDSQQMNDAAIQSGGDRIFAAYEHHSHEDWRIWIITEWDRSYTTILFPDEY